jgi:hypothetical protein
MNKRRLLLFIFLGIFIKIYSQNIVIKNNLLYDATATPNLGLEFSIGKSTTIDINGGLNTLNFSNNKKWKHWLAQPELRFWKCENFNGLFWGIHAHCGQFNVGAIDLPFNILTSLSDHRYEGYFYGGGLSIGYQWVMNSRWNLETSIGGGYARIHYDKFLCPSCGPRVDSGNQNYFGPTKAAISIIYMLH